MSYQINTPITYTAVASVGGQPGHTFSYAWAFDDNTTGAVASLPHSWATTGLHSATVTATDTGTGSTAFATKTILVSQPIPDTIGGSFLKGYYGSGKAWVVMGLNTGYSYVPGSFSPSTLTLTGMARGWDNFASSAMTSDGLYIVSMNTNNGGKIYTLNTATGSFSTYTIDTSNTALYGPNAATLGTAVFVSQIKAAMTGVSGGKVCIFFSSPVSGDLGWSLIFNPATQTMDAVDYGTKKYRYGWASATGSDGYAYCFTPDGYAKADPATGATTAVTSANSNLPDYVCGAVQVIGDNIYLIGGGNGGGSSFDQVVAFNVLTQAYTNKTPTTDNFNYVTSSVLLNDGRIFICGGGSGAFINANQLRAGGFIYSPTLNTWTATANSMTVPRRNHAMITLPNGIVMICGGQTYGDPFGGVTTSVTEFFDPVANTFYASE